MLTLDEFIKDTSWQKSQYIKYPNLSVYLRRSKQFINVNGKYYYCEEIITIANITANKPGKHSLKALINDILKYNKAVYIECVQPEWLQEKLLSYGFIRVNYNSGHHYLFNYEGKLNEFSRLRKQL